MQHSDTLVQRLSFYGRLVDDLTREVIPYKSFRVSIKGTKSMTFYKEDGYFAFSDVQQSALAYEFNLTSNLYQPRTVQGTALSDLPVELTYPGEDELYVLIKGVEDGETKKVTFNNIPFVKTIREGSEVKGQGGFSSKLGKTLGGEDADFAILEDVTGLNSGDILRFIRSHGIIMRPGPCYPFEPQTTLLFLKFVEDNLSEVPVAGVKVEIEKVNDTAINTVNVGSLAVKTVALTGPPAANLILGSSNDIISYSNSRGECIFYYPADTPIAKVKLKITKTGYLLISEEIELVNKQRTSEIIKLAKT